MSHYIYDNSLDAIDNIAQRNLSDLEKDALNILSEFIAIYFPNLSAYYKNYNYITGKKLGCFGYYNNEHLFLDIAIFAMPFSHCEWAVDQ